MNLKDKIKQVDISNLIPYNQNPKKHPNSQIDKIASSIKKFGFTVPILIKGDNEIIAGHGRVEAAKKLGIDEVPAIVRDDLTDAEAKAFRLADNRLAESNWDEDLLTVELEELEEIDFDLELTGFDEEEINTALDEETEVDEVETPNKDEVDTNIERGDILKLGEHRLMCGDATEEEDIDKLVKSEEIDMVLTDPPYALFGNSTGVDGVADDKMVMPFFKSLLRKSKKYVKLFGHIYVFCDWHSAFSIEKASRVVNLDAKNLCIWDKGDGGVGAMYQQCYEMIWFFSNSPQNKTTTNTTPSGERTINGVPNIWRYDRVPVGKRNHNAAKPVELLATPMEASTNKNENVLDLFGGSGSTLIAAEQLDRKCYMMEIDPQYCEVIKQRWEDYTGKEAEYV